ncbi:NADH-quinone oxidoreductase subunit C [bacterium]|nr:NADH-quinone oxidoreductase subunit C [bacterium]
MEQINELKARYSISDSRDQRPDLGFITVDPGRLAALLAELQQVRGYTHLSFITAVDYPETGTFQLTYMVHNFESAHSLGVRTVISRDTALMESVHHLWKQAKTYQRELKEMYGIDFPGSPGVDDPFILEGWQGPPPMRRDFDTRAYSEKTYFPRPGRKTSDPRRHMQSRLYPDYTPFEEET